MRNPNRIIIALLATAAISCGGSKRTTRGGQPFFENRSGQRKATPAPDWIGRVDIRSDKLCGLGIAGAAYDEDSPYPKQLSEERAVRNLAGVLETLIEEAIIDRETHRGLNIEMVRILHIDEELIAQVAESVDTEFWIDAIGEGPFNQKNFTYAHSCLSAKVAAGKFEIDVSAAQKNAKAKRVSPDRVPNWIDRRGKQPGGRLCTVGFSLPTFHPDKTFAVVVEDVRSQMAVVLEALVSSYYEELTTNNYQLIEMMNMATSQAVSKGAIVTDFWYDRDGIGPFKRRRTTYGWGCVYPVDVMLKTVAVAEEQLPDEKDAIAQVRERAKNAFADLDAEIEKRAPQSSVAQP